MNLGQQLKDIANVPADQAMSLTGQHYTNPAYFEEETRGILWHGWHCLGRIDEIPEAGDFFTTNLLKEPLLVVRGDDHTIRVLSNVCRHRGMPVATGKGSARRFVCRYHAWSYQRNGRLASAPRMPKDRMPTDCGLPEFQCEVWNGFIYVNLSGKAGSISGSLGKLDALIKDYEPENMEILHVEEEDWRCNWKCLVENFMEAYHLSVVHPETLHPYTPTGLSRKSLSDQSFTSYIAHYPTDIMQRYVGASTLSKDQRFQSRLFCAYPCHLASQSAGLLASLSLQPVAVDKVHVRWTLSAYRGELDEAAATKAVTLWQQVNREDREKLEEMQPALASATAVSGPLAPSDYEGTIWDFYQYLAKNST